MACDCCRQFVVRDGLSINLVFILFFALFKVVYSKIDVVLSHNLQFREDNHVGLPVLKV